ncbi:amidase family protein [Saccharopolyspora sp. CA-218241]|uniref:amidase family protein n=1 Tax=Saccharopolyspora sp. CA-218241 TaxID=3240027 RepID=UPI003D985E1B
MTDPTSLSATAQLAELAAGRLGAVELLDAHLARRDAVDQVLGAVVAEDRERARAEAARIDDARARGAELGRLAGLPMTVKDCFDVEGLPAVCGSPELAGRSPRCADAAVVAAVRSAGAVVWGKTNVPPMLGDVQTYNAVYGRTTHPMDPALSPGGSSGGAAAALAAGFTPLEIGSDLGGSLRTPAAFCGVLALKPGPRRLPSGGQIPPDPPAGHPGADLPVVGPMARTAADLRLLWSVLAGTRPRPEAPADRPLRLGLWCDDPHLLSGAEVVAALHAAAAAVADAGHHVEVVPPPVPGDVLLDAYFALLFPLLAQGMPEEAAQRMRARRDAASRAVADGASRYGGDAAIVHSTAPEVDRVAAAAVLAGLRDDVSALLGSWDALLVPAAPVAAIPHDTDRPPARRTIDTDGRPEPYRRLLDWAAPATALGLPSVALPVGRTARGLPLGGQLIGAAGDEDRLLGIAALVERVLHVPGTTAEGR